MTSFLTQGYNLNNFEASFREFLIVENVSPITLKNYLSDLRHFLGWFVLAVSSDTTIVDKEHNDSPYHIIAYLDGVRVHAYKKYLEDNRLPHKTINRRLSTVRKFCSFCIAQGWLKENPAKDLTNVAVPHHQHLPATFKTEIDVDRNDNVNNNFVFSAKQLFEFQKSLSHLPVAEAQTISKDIEEFFIITNSSNVL